MKLWLAPSIVFLAVSLVCRLSFAETPFVELNLNLPEQLSNPLDQDSYLTPEGALHILTRLQIIVHSNGYSVEETQNDEARFYFIKKQKNQSSDPMTVPDLVPFLVFKMYHSSETAVSEFEMLKAVDQSKLAQLPLLSQELPRISLPEGTFCYDNKGQNRCFGIFHFAKGKELFEILKKGIHYSSLPSLNSVDGEEFTLASRAFHRVGLTLAKLHFHFAANPSAPYSELKSYTHGDLHVKNVFFDPQSDRVYLIDNATFYYSLKSPLEVKSDVDSILMLAGIGRDEEMSQKSIFLHQQLIEGYLEGAPPHRTEEIKLFLQKMLADRLERSRESMRLPFFTVENVFEGVPLDIPGEIRFSNESLIHLSSDSISF